MVVYLVIHNDGDYESQNVIRGCYATRELAEQVVTTDETGTKPADDLGPERHYRDGHSAHCCAVEETVVETRLPEPFVLNPEKPYELQRRDASIPRVWIDGMLDSLTRSR